MRFLRHCGFVTFIFAVLLLVPSVYGLDGEDGPGAVYVLTNQSSGNTVVVFRRNADGVLSRTQEVSTHGLGSGGIDSPLGSQGALATAFGGHLLLAVNASSNDLSVLAVMKDGVHFVEKIASGGLFPVSVTVHDDQVFVLNAGGTPNVSGFFIDPSGRLQPLPGSTHALAGGPQSGPAQVLFSPDGSLLVVTEKATNLIDIFAVDRDGHIARATSRLSNNATPFGFSFAHSRELIVSEASGGIPGASTVSSYKALDRDDEPGDLRTISKSVPDAQTAACWIAVTGNGRIAFTSNTGSGTISSFAVAPGGALSLLSSLAADLGAGSAVTDMALARNSRFLYALSANFGTVTGFRVSGGHLTEVTSQGGLPLSIQGIVAE